MNRRAIFMQMKGAGALPLVVLATQVPCLSRFVGTLAQTPSVQSAESVGEDEAPLLQLCVEDSTTWLQKGAGMWRLDLYSLPDEVEALTTNLAYSGNGRLISAIGPYGRAVAKMVWVVIEPLLPQR